MIQRILLPALLVAGSGTSQAFTNFESPQTKPIAVTPDGLRLLALNTPDHRLSVYTLHEPSHPRLLWEIPVGLEPVSVTPRDNDEVWVTNRLSDSISIISLELGVVVDTIRAKDEPAHVVFAGSPQRAFVSVSGSHEVRVFDPDTRRHLATIPIFGEEPRAMAVSADGSRVWLAVHRSGNRTTIVPVDLAPPPPPPTNPALPPPPQAGLIVDSEDPAWKPQLDVDLPDIDVVELDAATLTATRSWSGVGTILFSIAVRPGDGSLWVPHTEARNLVRFEPALRGHAIDSRLARIRPGGQPEISTFDLNPGIDYRILPNPAARAVALSQPTDLVFSPSGRRLYVSAFGTDRVAVVDPADGAILDRIEMGRATGALALPREKRGPRGLAHHPTAPVLYVLNRLSSGVGVVDAAQRRLVREIPFLHDPTPAVIREGRGFLYDAKLSGNGTMSCASCHVDADIDGLAWDLGDPGGRMETFQNIPMHPMKGPLTTQTLFGLKGLEPFHWRGDRPRLQDFNGAFDSLMGGDRLSQRDMDDFVTFQESLTFPPNPNQNLDRTLPRDPPGVSAQDGFVFFTQVPFISVFRCVDCHTLPWGSNGAIIPGPILQSPQSFKVPHLRNLYKRMGRIPAAGGARKSGFGILHDGSVDSVFDLLSHPAFGPISRQADNKRKLERFMLAFDTGTAPIVGYQVTVTAANASSPEVAADLALLTSQAAAGNADLAARGWMDGERLGLLYEPDDVRFVADRAGLGPFDAATLLARAAAGRALLTFTGAPPGSGERIARDRRLTGVPDGDQEPRVFGAPTPGCSGSPSLRAVAPAWIGNDQFALAMEGVDPSSPWLLLLSPGPAALNLSGLRIWVDPDAALLLVAFADATGTGVFPLPVPPAPALFGGRLYAQGLAPSACGPLGLSATRGLALTIVR